MVAFLRASQAANSQWCRVKLLTCGQAMNSWAGGTPLAEIVRSMGMVRAVGTGLIRATTAGATLRHRAERYSGGLNTPSACPMVIKWLGQIPDSGQHSPLVCSS